MSEPDRSTDDGEGGSGVETISKQKTRLKPPKQYKVLLLNDDYTTMEFVIEVLESVFKKNPAEAMQIMLNVHRQGRGVAGIYTKEIAEAKITLVHARASEEGYPLKCSMEEA